LVFFLGGWRIGGFIDIFIGALKPAGVSID
jgi:hypothetical protein